VRLVNCAKYTYVLGQVLGKYAECERVKIFSYLQQKNCQRPDRNAVC
jgi:hypothetical protein